MCARVESVSTREYPAKIVHLIARELPLGTAPNHFRFDRVASTLQAFEPSAPRLQRPGSRAATNLVVHRRNAIVFFCTRLRPLSQHSLGAIER